MGFPPRLAVAMACLAATGRMAAAQQAPEQAIDAQVFKPAMDPGGIFSLEGTRGPARWDVALRLGLSYDHAPLKLAVEHVGDGGRDDVLESILTVDLGVSFGLSDRLSFAFDVPLRRQPLGFGYGQHGLYSPAHPSEARPGTGFYSVRPDQNVGPSEDSPGDPRIGLKYRVLEGKLGLALQAIAHVPLGDEDVFAGSDGVTAEPKLVADWTVGDRGLVALNLGARLRRGVLAQTRRVDDAGYVLDDEQGQPVYRPLLFVGSEAVVGLGGRYPVAPGVDVAGEAFALVPIASASAADCTDGCASGDLVADVLGGFFFRAGREATIAVAAGVSATPEAARAETFRVLLSYVWSPADTRRESTLKLPGGRED